MLRALITRDQNIFRVLTVLKTYGIHLKAEDILQSYSHHTGIEIPDILLGKEEPLSNEEIYTLAQQIAASMGIQKPTLVSEREQRLKGKIPEAAAFPVPSTLLTNYLKQEKEDRAFLNYVEREHPSLLEHYWDQLSDNVSLSEALTPPSTAPAIIKKYFKAYNATLFLPESIHEEYLTIVEKMTPEEIQNYMLSFGTSSYETRGPNYKDFKEQQDIKELHDMDVPKLFRSSNKAGLLQARLYHFPNPDEKLKINKRLSFKPNSWMDLIGTTYKDAGIKLTIHNSSSYATHELFSYLRGEIKWSCRRLRPLKESLQNQL